MTKFSSHIRVLQCYLQRIFCLNFYTVREFYAFPGKVFRIRKKRDLNVDEYIDIAEIPARKRTMQTRRATRFGCGGGWNGPQRRVAASYERKLSEQEDFKIRNGTVAARPLAWRDASTPNNFTNFRCLLIVSVKDCKTSVLKSQFRNSPWREISSNYYLISSRNWNTFSKVLKICYENKDSIRYSREIERWNYLLAN